MVSIISSCRNFLAKSWVRGMSSSKQSYENAIHKLNGLQSNKATIQQIQQAIKSGQEKCTNLEEMENYLLRTGVSLSQLDELSVIHVAGTKGKGSTSAMCESILRAHGLRTGLYTSPHLVAVRERVRLAGAVVSRDQFAQHFHRIYDLLDGSKAHEDDMPKYFAFLTVLAYNMFLAEKVDVAIVEVGIGGVVDYTNILRKVPVVGITSLGLDHTSILGNTIELIAAAKAGIMKPGCEAYTVWQPDGAMAVLRAGAADVKCTLNIVPDYKTYICPEQHKTQLPVDLDAYRTNASLAIQLAHAWIRLSELNNLNRRNLLKKQVVSGKIIRQNGFIEIDCPFSPDDKFNGNDVLITTLPNETVVGLEECRWPGRYHIIRSDYATFYLDGAHTKESMEICVKWFEDNNRYQDKIVIFSATGDRDVEVLLKPLRSMKFLSVFFVIPTAYKSLNENSDNYSLMEHTELFARCQRNAQIWMDDNDNDVTDVKIRVLECVSDALIDIKLSNYDLHKTSILITGSLHLVGAALSILDPNLSKD